VDSKQSISTLLTYLSTFIEFILYFEYFYLGKLLCYIPMHNIVLFNTLHVMKFILCINILYILLKIHSVKKENWLLTPQFG